MWRKALKEMNGLNCDHCGVYIPNTKYIQNELEYWVLWCYECYVKDKVLTMEKYASQSFGSGLPESQLPRYWRNEKDVEFIRGLPKRDGICPQCFQQHI
jgi:hypothetical protein